jgi:hypothetical protein
MYEKKRKMSPLNKMKAQIYDVTRMYLYVLSILLVFLTSFSHAALERSVITYDVLVPISRNASNLRNHHHITNVDNISESSSNTNSTTNSLYDHTTKFLSDEIEMVRVKFPNMNMNIFNETVSKNGRMKMTFHTFINQNRINSNPIKLSNISNCILQLLQNDEEGEFKKEEGSMSIFSIASVFILFGAVSARRAIIYQRRVFKNGWFSNQRLEDELTYDIAFTTVPIDLRYGSFDGAWTGDLGKFDV